MVSSTRAERLERAASGAKSSKVEVKSTEQARAVHKRRTTRLHWTLLAVIITVLPYYLSGLHYALPKPLPPVSENGPQPSEEVVLSHIQALEDIGYRTVGTPQARDGEAYVEDQVRQLKSRCDADGVLQCDVWVQTGDGFHEFSIMDHDVLKVYKGVSNVILRIRGREEPVGGRPQRDAVLLGSHIDSALPAPGAADDGIGVGVMLDIARVLIDRKQPINNSIIFLWNGAEETLQDASHLYSTQHETAKEVQTVINLEAAGVTGGALLFQATSKEMIEAFAHAPHTDFVQFEQYLNVSGLDLAIVGHSYFYHTQKDRIEFIETGAAQHFASNVQAVVDYLLSPESPLHSKEPWSPPRMVYLSLYDRYFFKWSMESATRAYLAIATIASSLAASRIDWRKWKIFVLAFVSNAAGFVAGILAANLVAGITTLLDSRLAWFRHEHLCMILFVPAAYTGHLTTQLLLSKSIKRADRARLEHAHFYVQVLYPTFGMLILQAHGIRSAYIFAFITVTMLVGALGNESVRIIEGTRYKLGFGWAYLVTAVGSVVLSVEAVTTVLDIFTPLAGRMGTDAPAEFIIATISSACAFIFFPPAIPLFHRLSRSSQVRTILALLAFILSIIALFASPWWKTYDYMHPKRTGVQYTYNHTSGAYTAHIAFMDSGPELDFLQAVYERYGEQSRPVERTTDYEPNPDWDVLYPISSFLDSYRFYLPPAEFEWPAIGVKVNETRGEGTRQLDLTLDFTGFVSPTLSFEAEILDWSFDFTPPKGFKRHYLKLAVSVDDPHVDLSLTVRDEGKGSVLPISWSAIDLNQMVPGTAAAMGPDMPASKLLQDLQTWAAVKYEGSLEILTYGAVVGEVNV